MNYYNGIPLLSKKDLAGETPEIFICTSNRTAGKTTFFTKYLIDKWLNDKKQFCLLYRYGYELENVHNKFFSDVSTLFYNGMEMTSKNIGKDTYAQLYLDKELCGFAIPLNKCDQIKKYSHVFNNVLTMFFDEFQPENDTVYLKNEVDKLLSVHTSIARGQGKQRRYVPIILCGNPVTIINPYYTALGISDRLRKDTKFLRGNGWVMEQGFNESAKAEQEKSGVFRAFKNSDYIAYSKEGIYLSDNDSLILNQPTGRNRYICTLKIGNKLLAVRSYADAGIIYVSNNVDQSAPIKICVSNDGVNENFVSIKNYMFFLNNLREYFSKGCVRFKNQECKKLFINSISL